MASSPPGWTPFSDSAPPALAPVDSGGRVVAVVAASTSATTEWAADAAVRLARGWSDRGPRVVLADAGLHRPTLHSLLGMANEEGVSDAVLYGASPRRVARPVEGGGLLFVSSGTAVSDAGAVFEASRWRALVGAFRQADATLVLWFPSPEDTPDSVLAEADDVVFLGTPGDDTSWISGTGKVRALLRRPGPTHPAPGPPEPEDPLAPLAPDPLLAAREIPPPPEPLRPAVPRQQPPAGRRTLVRAVVGLVVVAAVTVVAFRLGARSEAPVAGARPTEATPAEGPSAASAAPSAPAPDSASSPDLLSPLRGYSVTLGSFTDQAGADARRRALEGLLPRGLLYTAPVRVGGTGYHRLLLGPAPDSAGAAALAAETAEALGADPGGWVVRPTPLAFHLGEYGSLEEAGSEVTRWQEEGIPVYVLSVMYSDSTLGFRVYAGAYADATEATYLGEMLSAVGVGTAPLIPRVGTLPAG